MEQTMAPAILGGVSEIADHYDGFIVDLWGCVHNGIEPFPAAVDALLKLSDHGKVIALLSNAPRRSDALIARLDEMGVPRHAYHFAMSSGEATWRALAERSDAFHASLGNRCYHLGPTRDVSVCTGNDLIVVDFLENADFILNTGPLEHSDTVADYLPLLEHALARELPMICANPDLVVHIGEQLVICAGAIAERYGKMGGRVAYHGKPHSSVYEQCAAFFATRSATRLLSIGDGLRTDILGAFRAGLSSIFLTNGIHADDLGSERLEPAAIERIAAGIGAVPTYAMSALRWAA
jgi:HAD superfamily hydrolase (TIGR01459 family)